MSTLNQTTVFSGAEVAVACGITRQGWEHWIKSHEHRFPPDYTLLMGKKQISLWLPHSVNRIIEARQP